MKQSDIFDDFAKIALEKGIIKKASPEELKKKLEQNPRMDSLDLSAIEALYGVKPNLPKNMEYEYNIVDDAHPNSVVVSPAHDKLNGLVENINERQKIILNIVNKNNDGHLTNKKYAEKELILTLVKLGNTLDNSKKDELRILADTCLQQLADLKKKDLEKVAVGPAIIAGLIAVPVTIGALWFQQHSDFVNEGFDKNHEKLIAEIDDMLEDKASWGVGQEYTSAFISQLQDFKAKLNAFYSLYKQTSNVINSLEQPKTAKELMEIANKPKTENVKRAYNILRSNIENLLPYIEVVERNFASEIFKIKQIVDKGWMQKLVDWTQVLHGGKGLIADDFDDVRRALKPYKKSITDIITILREAKTLEDNAQNQLQQAAIKSQQMFGNENPDVVETSPEPSKTPSTFVSPEIKEQDDLIQDIIGA